MLTTLEQLEQYTDDHNIKLLTTNLPENINGVFYADPDFSAIALSSSLETDSARCSVLAEELGHFHTSTCNLFFAPNVTRAAEERRAVAWAANSLLPISRLIEAWQAGVRDLCDLADYFGVTERFILRALELHTQHYGMSTQCHGYLITFDLLHIQEVSV